MHFSGGYTEPGKSLEWKKEMDIKVDLSLFRVQAQDKIFTKTAAIYK